MTPGKDEGPHPNKGPEAFVFPNLNTGKPMWQESILDRQIKPAAERAGLGSIGWHTFRHSYRAWLKRANAPTILTVVLLLASVTLIATTVPTLRIARIDPAKTLRDE